MWRPGRIPEFRTGLQSFSIHAEREAWYLIGAQAARELVAVRDSRGVEHPGLAFHDAVNPQHACQAEVMGLRVARDNE